MARRSRQMRESDSTGSGRRGIGILVCVGRSVYTMLKKSRRSGRKRMQGERRGEFRKGFGSETDPAGLENKERTPPEFGISGGGGLDDQPCSDLRLSPSGLPEPAGRFHRGATRSELVMTTADGIDRCLA